MFCKDAQRALCFHFSAKRRRMGQHWMTLRCVAGRDQRLDLFFKLTLFGEDQRLHTLLRRPSLFLILHFLLEFYMPTIIVCFQDSKLLLQTPCSFCPPQSSQVVSPPSLKAPIESNFLANSHKKSYSRPISVAFMFDFWGASSSGWWKIRHAVMLYPMTWLPQP